MNGKIKTIVIDDEPMCVEIIKSNLVEYGEIELVAACDSARDAYERIENIKPDLIFLDIQMPELDGFELLKLLHHNPHVIFCSAYEEYALKAFEYSAVDYLLKPFNQRRFKNAIEKAINDIKLRKSGALEIEPGSTDGENKQPDSYPEHFFVKQSGKIFIVDANEIKMIKAMNYYVELSTDKGAYLIQQSMNNMEKQLNPNRFFRAHRSYLVNLNEIREIQNPRTGKYKLFLKNGEEVPVSRAGVKKLKNLLL